MRLGVGLHFIGFVLLTSACSVGEGVSPRSKQPTGLHAAEWDAGAVTAEDVRLAVNRLPGGLKEQFATPGGREQFVHALVARKLLAEEAFRRGLHQAPEVAEQVRELQERLAVQSLLAQAEAELPPPGEQEIKAYFDSHASEFEAPRRVRVARLLVRGEAASKAARTRAEGLRRRLVAREPLGEVMKLGEGPEATAGGDVGWISSGSDVETAAALALKAPGDVSPIIETSAGLSILVATAVDNARPRTLEESQAQILERLAPVRQRRAFDALVARLRAQADVRFNFEAVR